MRCILTREVCDGVLTCYRRAAGSWLGLDVSEAEEVVAIANRVTLEAARVCWKDVVGRGDERPLSDALRDRKREG